MNNLHNRNKCIIFVSETKGEAPQHCTKMEEQKKDGRGGARAGAGRKKAKRTKAAVTCYLDFAVIDKIDKIQGDESRNAFIEAAVMEKLERMGY